MIRRACEKDKPEIHELLKQVHKIHSEGRPDYFKSGGIKYTGAELSIVLSDNSRPIFVFVDSDNKIRGYMFCIEDYIEDCSSLYSRHTLYIDDLCVDSNFRGQGIGTKLYNHALDFARRNGCKAVTLRVWSFNKEAMSFYEKHGMKPMHTTMEQIL